MTIKSDVILRYIRHLYIYTVVIRFKTNESFDPRVCVCECVENHVCYDSFDNVSNPILSERDNI